MVASLTLSAQQAFTLFTDCDNCDFTYMMQEIPYVAHVRVPVGADVRLLVTSGGTGGGGRRYDLSFVGLAGGFEEQTEEVSFQIEANSSDDAIRTRFVRAVKRGLLPYLLKTELAEEINYSVAVPDNSTTEATTQNTWDNWIFGVYAEGDYEDETAQKAIRGEMGLEADRVTEATRIRIDASLDYREREIDRDTAIFIRIRRDWYGAASMVWSLGPHWSAGGFAGYEYSTFENLDNSYFINPAIEYNIYPYDEVLRREISIAYRIGYRQNNYLETTIFDETSEGLYYTSLNAQARFRQPWGTINASVDASAFLRDLKQNRTQGRAWVELNLYRGLALRFSGRLSLIRNQINLPAESSSIEDILLRQRQIATDFRADASVGVSYTFGYLTNNIINYRL
jgi:hypothetical protein